MKIGIDAGNHEVKIFGHVGAFRYSSLLGEYRDRNLQEQREGDLIYEFRGKKGFAGQLAEIESNYSGSVAGTTKAHEDTLIRVLLGIAQYKRQSDKYQIVVGQPIIQHTEAEKLRIKKLLQGDHAIVLNDQRHNILIERVEVSAEGGVAFWSSPRKGLVRILDFGSGTVNGATLIDGKYVDRDSFTADYGMGIVTDEDRDAFMRSIFIQAQRKRWKKSDSVHIVGYSAESMLPHAQLHFENAEVLRPKDPFSEGSKLLHPVYANAVGMFNVAQRIFQ